MKSRDKIYRLEVAIKSLRPTIWRDIVVPGDYSLRDLHLVLQSAMGWENCHRHAFALDEEPFSLDDAGSTEHEEYEAKTKISDLLKQDGQVLRYLYDFNDNWEHTVTVKTVYKRNPRHFYPNCLGGEMACPPEDIGGISAYKQLLKAIENPEEANKESPLDTDLITWYSDLKPDVFSQKECNDRLKLWDTMSWGTDFGLDLKDLEDDDDDVDDDEKKTGTLVHEEIVELDEDDVELMDVAERKTSRPPKRVVTYDPSVGADFGSWLDLSEEETILATKKYHDDHQPKMDKGSAIIHAAMHAVIETQIAMIDPPQVHRTFTKLIDGGLDRHDAIHIVGSVLAEQLYHLMELQKSAQYNPYGRSLVELDVKKWKKYYDELKNPSADQEDDINETKGTVQIHADDILELQERNQSDEPEDRESAPESEADLEQAEQDEADESRSSIGDLKLDLDSEVIMALNEEDELDEARNSDGDLKLDLDSEVIMAFDEEDEAEELENSADDLQLEIDAEEVQEDTADDDDVTEDDLEIEAVPKKAAEDTTDDDDVTEDASESEDDPEQLEEDAADDDVTEDDLEIEAVPKKAAEDTTDDDEP